MHKINHNISSIKLGETFCYHIGNLAKDRQERRITGEEVTDKGKIKVIYGGISNEAIITNKIAEILYLRSTAIWDKASEKMYGTCEFSLFQKKLASNKYVYLATKISDKPRIRTAKSS